VSIQAVGAVLDYSRATKGARLTAISLANHADKHGITWPSLRLAGEEALLKRRAVQEGIKNLRERGELVLLVDADGKTHRPPLYWMRLAGLSGAFSPEGSADNYFKAFGEELRDEAEAAVASLDPGAESAPPPGADGNTGGVQKTTSPPYKEPSTKPETRAGERKEVNRKPVSDAEYELAAAIVTAFNAIFDTAVSTDAHLVPVVGRIRERPELTDAQHRKVMEAVATGRQWWDTPAPRIVYGNAARFEESIEAARAAHRQRSKTTRQGSDANERRKRTRREQGLDD
jgi:hypothetical protein